MRLLTIETSCDETSVAVTESLLAGDAAALRGTFRALAHFTASQAANHAAYGGVFPTLAKREHTKNLPVLLEAALNSVSPKDKPARRQNPKEELPAARLEEVRAHEGNEFVERMTDLLERFPNTPFDGVAVTYGPGLDPALWVGVNAARILACGWRLPLWGAHHLEGHLVSACITPERAQTEEDARILAPVAFPLVGLIVSGGHTDLIALTRWDKREVLGRTRDDAAGEAFDKSARMLGLPYPGGPAIASLAQQAREKGETLDVRLPRPMLESESLDFSFAGLKTALRRELQKRGFDPERPALPEALRRAFAREVEEAITETLLAKLESAREQTGARSIAIGGGVAANRYFKDAARRWAREQGLALFVPPAALASDNAFMVAMGAEVDIHLSLIPPADPNRLRPDPSAPWPAAPELRTREERETGESKRKK
ncbi:MAG: tRNA N6-adenosine threonylcarbamoyltransferase [Candidatus Parcubacteria bacterium]|nr:MAG: tRNA N6-adenosine threonylcarbamoyltransferase [Candidatus Parcubacteria bacterium]